MPRTDLTIIIGRNIRHRRLLAGLSQHSLEYHLGVSFQQVQKYERGISSISCEKLIAVEKWVGSSIDELCDGAAGDALYDPTEPWNPYKVYPLMASFNRIRSRQLRNKACGLVSSLARLDAGDVEPSL